MHTTRSVLTGRTGIQPAPFTDDLTTALNPLGRLAGIEAGWVLPVHCAPWQDDPAEAQELARHAKEATGR